jgi:2-polyprenyl-3-methyl-5-hydroxy-6-metoxy-1,4-benzoquinol methylase
MLNWDPTNHYKEVAVAERYDRERFSSVSGKVFNRLEKKAVRSAFDDVPRGTTVLDVPCGTGRLAEPLLARGLSVHGVDISPAMLDVAKRKLARFGSSFATQAIDVRELSSVQPKSFDVALCARVLMHFPLEGQIEFLRAVVQLARGRVVFTQSYSSPYQRMRRKVKRALGNQPPSAYPINEKELKQLLEGAGLKERRRILVAPLISEAAVFVCEPV